MITADFHRRNVWPTIFAMVVLLTVAYGAAYLALVKRVQLRNFGGRLTLTVIPAYPHESLIPVFKPAHWIDCHLIRQSYWEPR